MIQKIFNFEGKKLLTQLLSEKIRPDMSRAQKIAIRHEVENSDQLKKYICGWRIRPWIIEDGKNIQICETYSRYDDAKKRLREIENKVEEKTFTRRSKIPLVSKACDTWLQSKKDDAKEDGGARSDSTIDFYQNIIEKHIKPEIGDLPLDEVTKTRAISARKKWAETLGISVNKVLMVARSVYEEHGDIVSKNPFKQVKNVSRKDGRKSDEAKEIDPENVFSSRAEVETLLAYADNDQDRLMLRLAAECGLRDGELLGLVFDNVLPVEKGKILNEIRIVQQWRCRKKDYDPHSGAPLFHKYLKSSQGQRTIPVSRPLAIDLLKWKQAHRDNPWGLMFVNSVGRPCHRKNLSKAMDKAIVNAKKDHISLKDLDYYSLRHFYASILIQQMKEGDLSDLEIAKLMGHKDSTITRKTYAKWLKGESSYNPDAIFANRVEPIKPPLEEMEAVSKSVN